MFKKKMKIVEIVLVLSILTGVAAFADPNVIVFPYMNTHNRPNTYASYFATWGKQGGDIYKRIADGSTPNPIWNETNVFWSSGGYDDYSWFDTGRSQLTWLLSLHNPTNTDFVVDGEDDRRITVKFYKGWSIEDPDGVITEDTCWRCASRNDPSYDPGEEISGEELIHDSASGDVVWDDDSDQFFVSLEAGESIMIPCWGGTTGFFNEPGSSDDRFYQPFMIVTQPDGYELVATIRGNGLGRYRSGSGNTIYSFLYSPYYGSNYTYSGIYLNDYVSGYDQKLVVPWFRERYFSGTNTSDYPDWSNSFVVINAGGEGDITIEMKNMDGTSTGWVSLTQEFGEWERGYFMPCQFVALGSSPSVINGRIEVYAAEGSDAIPVCISIQARYQKTSVSYGGQAYRIPSVMQCEPFHILNY